MKDACSTPADGADGADGMVQSAIHRCFVDQMVIEPSAASSVARYLSSPMVVGLSMVGSTGLRHGTSHAEMEILLPEIPNVMR